MRSPSAGRIEIHGVALCPGETAGFGHTAAGAPVLLLPGTPAGCLWSYELFAGRAIRRFGGRDPALPQRPCVLTTARKIVSSIGVTEICPVRLCSDREIEPIAGFAEGGLMAAAGADGFVIVAEFERGVSAGSLGDGVSLRRAVSPQAAAPQPISWRSGQAQEGICARTGKHVPANGSPPGMRRASTVPPQPATRPAPTG